MNGSTPSTSSDKSPLWALARSVFLLLVVALLVETHVVSGHAESIYPLAFLAVAVHWVRLRLVRQANRQAVTAERGPGAETPPNNGVAFFGGLESVLLLGLGAVMVLNSVPLRGSLVGEHFEQGGYAALRLVLTPKGEIDPPVVVIDIGGLPMTDPGDKSRVRPVTQRGPLLKFLTAVTLHAAPADRPRAVGIDLNFTPDPGSPLHPEDARFFEACLAIQGADGRNPAVRLGVFCATTPRPGWLWMDRFADLAAGMETLRSDTGYLPSETSFSPELGTGPTPLGVSVAKAYLAPNPLPEGGGFFRLYRREKIERDGLAVKVESFLVDYSWLNALKNRMRPLGDYDDPELRAGLGGKIVLLGHVKGAPIEDAFVVPGEKVPVPGVYLHACAAATLVTAPIRQLSPVARLLFDLVLAAIAVLWFTYVNVRVSTRQSDRAEVELVPAFAIMGAAALVAGLMLTQLRLFWPDFIVAGVLIGIHPSAEWVLRESSHGLLRLVRAGGRGVRRFVRFVRAAARWVWRVVHWLYSVFARGRNRTRPPPREV